MVAWVSPSGDFGFYVQAQWEVEEVLIRGIMGSEFGL